jgi:RHS repeat-associated protein
MGYDGLGRRIVKAAGYWTYHYYYDGQSVVETRNGSNQALRQQVWGAMYVDELVQIGINSQPSQNNDCIGTGDTVEYVVQDANYNVIGVTDTGGVLKERYEYDPYGKRKVFVSAGSYDPELMSPREKSTGTTNGTVRCEFGHQGLMHDEETGLVYNRGRMLHPGLGRFMQRDFLGYISGLSLYEYVGSRVPIAQDPQGNEFGVIDNTIFSNEWQTALTKPGQCPPRGPYQVPVIDGFWSAFTHYTCGNGEATKYTPAILSKVQTTLGFQKVLKDMFDATYQKIKVPMDQCGKSGNGIYGNTSLVEYGSNMPVHGDFVLWSLQLAVTINNFYVSCGSTYNYTSVLKRNAANPKKCECCYTISLSSDCSISDIFTAKCTGPNGKWNNFAFHYLPGTEFYVTGSFKRNDTMNYCDSGTLP